MGLSISSYKEMFSHEAISGRDTEPFCVRVEPGTPGHSGFS